MPKKPTGFLRSIWWYAYATITSVGKARAAARTLVRLSAPHAAISDEDPFVVADFFRRCTGRSPRAASSSRVGQPASARHQQGHRVRDVMVGLRSETPDTAAARCARCSASWMIRIAKQAMRARRFDSCSRS